MEVTSLIAGLLCFLKKLNGRKMSMGTKTKSGLTLTTPKEHVTLDWRKSY